MTQDNKYTKKITKKQMKEAIKRSGYLLEQRVEPIIRDWFGYVNTNPVFKDPDTEKSCEIDLYAISASKLFDDEKSFIYPVLLCECENNPQPIVFFIGSRLFSFLTERDIKLSGLPVKFWNEKYKEYVPFANVVKLKNFHHFCTGEVSTQYCSFQKKKDKSNWMALHIDEQHDTFNKLIKAINYHISEHFDNWWFSEKVDEPVNLQIYYPLLIIQGELFTASLKNNQLILKKPIIYNSENNLSA
jgi:hypothetical protein